METDQIKFSTNSHVAYYVDVFYASTYIGSRVPRQNVLYTALFSLILQDTKLLIPDQLFFEKFQEKRNSFN